MRERLRADAGVPAIARAIKFSIVGEHFIRYTAEDVLPRLEQAAREIRSEAAGAVRPGMAARPVL